MKACDRCRRYEIEDEPEQRQWPRLTLVFRHTDDDDTEVYDLCWDCNEVLTAMMEGKAIPEIIDRRWLPGEYIKPNNPAHVEPATPNEAVKPNEAKP